MNEEEISQEKATEAAEVTGTAVATGTTGTTGNLPQKPQPTQQPQWPQSPQKPQKPQQPQWPQQPQQPQSPQSTQPPQQPQPPQPPRQPLTLQPFLPKKGNYRELLVYKKAECLYDITYYFAHTYFIPRKDRTVDQVVQAARSGKQNIAEGCSASATSSETEIKLIGVARASMQEVLTDYEDYLRTHGLQQWGGDDPRTRQAQEYCKKHYQPSDYTKGIEQRSPEAICNIAITLIHQYDKMMAKLLDRLQKDFVENGGIREQMTAARLGYRNNQKERIAQLEAENALPKARIAELEALLSQKGGEL